jgi:hypothetical protein
MHGIRSKQSALQYLTQGNTAMLHTAILEYLVTGPFIPVLLREKFKWEHGHQLYRYVRRNTCHRATMDAQNCQTARGNCTSFSLLLGIVDAFGCKFLLCCPHASMVTLLRIAAPKYLNFPVNPCGWLLLVLYCCPPNECYFIRARPHRHVLGTLNTCMETVRSKQSSLQYLTQGNICYCSILPYVLEYST